MSDVIDLVVGFDQRESVAYHTFCQSVIDTTSRPVRFFPLVLNGLPYIERHNDGSNAFIYSRSLTPFLLGFKGWAIFADGDMICRNDIADLWKLKDPNKAVQVVKHNYETKANIKYLGNKNENYPRKNWSSLILWNCAHPANRALTPELIQKKSGSYLHRFSWLSDDDIGEIDIQWNWLAIEYANNPNAKLVHYTLGTPFFREYTYTSMADLWYSANLMANEGMYK